MATSEKMKTGVVRLAFTNGLFEIQENEWGGRDWTCTLLIPKAESLAPYEKLALEAAEAEWPGKAKQLFRDKLIHNPFLDGDGPQGKSKTSGEPHVGFPGHWFLRVKSGEAYRPTLIDRQKMPIVDKAKLYSGCYVYAVVHVFTWDNKNKGKGLTFGLDMVQFVRDGENLGGSGGVDVDKWAETIPDEGNAPASTKGGAGAGGLFG
jgi:Enterobacter phage Enc34, ssDNA-binding protein